ncbi:MAG: FumA C-terminus/TtdB family hydratase beta subunit [Candidatus Omnitrophica bacterium]|nr:FumA C-terminus/TtdB family hydratase beta subunit [Candidatus Omnitrophota bacterium]
MKKINLSSTLNVFESLKAGEEVALSGVIYTARDQAHKRLTESIKGGKPLPITLKGAVIYYCGPTHTPKGRAIGSCGPTTSSRMDSFTPLLLARGLKGMIGKGNRAKEVREEIKKYKGVYFITYAGCGAFLAGHVKKSKVSAYRDLGPEAIMKLEVKDFPLIVAIDSRGKSIFKEQTFKK